MDILLLIAVLFVAAANGANDNFKGVATLYGSGVAGYRVSLVWACITTLGGSLCSAYLATALLHEFTGAGLVPAVIAGHSSFAFAVAGGAGLTIILATWRGLPVSTTHALIGAMCGAGLVAVGTGVQFATLGRTFLLPLLASPLIAIVPAALLAQPMRRLMARMLAQPASCVCAEDDVVFDLQGTAMLRSTATISAGARSDCERRGARSLLNFDSRRAAETLLFLQGGAIGFARGLNDTPKIAALLLPLAALGTHGAIATVSVAMLVGGLLGARRVANTLSHRITKLDLGAALTAGFTTSLLVGTASINGLPVSTTHVSVGALAGTGLSSSAGVDRRLLTGIGLAWVVTLPLGAAFGALLYGLAR